MSLHVASEGSGPPLVLLHGWAMHSGLWLPVLPQLAARHRVHMVDLPGHGYSATSEPYTLAGVAAAVAAALASLPEPPTVLGWSLGGAVALQWALAAPRAIARLVLVSTTPCFVRRDDWPQAMSALTLSRFGDELAASYPATLQRFLTLQVQDSERAREVLAQLRRQWSGSARGAPPQALRAALDVLAATDLRGQVAGIEHPALIISGERDTLVPAAAGAWLAAALPAGRHAPIAGAAHAPFLSHPEAFFAALQEFGDGR